MVAHHCAGRRRRTAVLLVEAPEARGHLSIRNDEIGGAMPEVHGNGGFLLLFRPTMHVRNGPTCHELLANMHDIPTGQHKVVRP